jgi:hypothetical protein
MPIPQCRADKEEGRRALLRLYRFPRRQPRLENLNFEYVSPECGVRETATIEGEVEVTAADYQSGRLWDDAVCHSFYPIDLHTSDGQGLSKHYLQPGTVPSVPLRAMLPKGSTNFLVARRTVVEIPVDAIRRTLHEHTAIVPGYREKQ